MKIAVVAGFSAEWNMNINTCHKLNFVNLLIFEMTKIKQYIRRILKVIMWCLFYSVTIAQKECRLIVSPVDASANAIEALKLTVVFNSKTSCIRYVQQLPSYLMSKGYASASVDSVWEDSSSVFIRLFPGERYLWNHLDVNENDWAILNQLGYSRETFNDKPFDQGKVNKIYEQLLDHFENNGYPFTKIYLNSIVLNNGLMGAGLNIDKGQLYYIDSISIKGDERINKNFLYHYLDLKKHDVYQKNKLDKINQRLAELPYLNQSQPWTITMLNTGSILNLYLESRKSNQVNVLVGLLPANEQLGGKLLLTGEANLNLRNPFGGGETIGLNWQQLQNKSPRLNLLFQKPYIFNSSFGLGFNFELYKKDSSYLNIHSQIGVQYVFSAKQSGTVFLQTSRTNLLNVDTLTVKYTKQLPPMIDVSSAGLALQYDFNNTNYRFNPRKGNELQFITGFGNKKIRKNNAILQLSDTSFDYKSLYDTVKQNTYQFRIRFAAAHYFPAGRQAAFKTALNTGWFQSPGYFQNELFQIGGYKLLRGFDEESIYTNRFAVGTLEYRYLLGQNSYFYGFADVGWARYESSYTQYSHTYLGFGTGLAFETKTGVFNISLAEGKRNDLKLDFRQSKIHVGFVSLF